MCVKTWKYKNLRGNIRPNKNETGKVILDGRSSINDKPDAKHLIECRSEILRMNFIKRKSEMNSLYKKFQFLYCNQDINEFNVDIVEKNLFLTPFIKRLDIWKQIFDKSFYLRSAFSKI